MSSLPLFLVAILLLLLSPVLASPSSNSLSSLAPLPNLHVFLVAGQSNAEGSDSDPILPEDAPTPRILQLQCCDGGTSLPPTQCYVNVSSDPMQTAIGGTGFGDGTWVAYTGRGFVAAVAKLLRTWDILHSNKTYAGYNVTFDGILWHQGEMDAGDNFHNYNATTSYYLNESIIPMIEALRNTSLIPFTYSTVPFVCGQLLPQWVNNVTHPERAGVRNALALLPQYVPYSGHAPSQGLVGDPEYRSGWDNSVIHFTGRSHRIFGRRYHAAFLAAQLNVPEHITKATQQPVRTGDVANHDLSSDPVQGKRRSRNWS